jgi:two-component system nitrate/nitrite response regulator NarL
MRRRPIATVLVGPSVLLREGLARILAAAGFRIVFSVSNVRELVWASLSTHQSTLLVIDAEDDQDAAVTQIRLFKEQHPSGRVAVLTDHYRPRDIVAAFQAGANVSFAKFVNCNAFTKALELVMLGETILPPELLLFIENRREDQDYPLVQTGRASSADALPNAIADTPPRLSIREKCILRCIVDGDSNKLIARKMAIAEATVKVHVKAILRKIRIHNRTQAAIWAMNNTSLIAPTDDCPSLALERPIEPAELPVLARDGNGANIVALSSIDNGRSVERKIS